MLMLPGSFGAVFQAKRIADGVTYAIKNVAIAELSRSEQLAALTEVKVLSSSDHPNVVAYYDSFIDDGLLHIVMEHCDKGDLQGLLKVVVQLEYRGNMMSRSAMTVIVTDPPPSLSYFPVLICLPFLIGCKKAGASKRNLLPP